MTNKECQPLIESLVFQTQRTGPYNTTTCTPLIALLQLHLIKRCIHKLCRIRETHLQ